jgi:formin 2
VGGGGVPLAEELEPPPLVSELEPPLPPRGGVPKGKRLATCVRLLTKGFVIRDAPPPVGGLPPPPPVGELPPPPPVGPVKGDRLAPKLGKKEPPGGVPPPPIGGGVPPPTTGGGVPPPTTGGPDVNGDRLPRNVAPAKAVNAPGKKYCKPITMSAIPIIIAIVIAM